MASSFRFRRIWLVILSGPGADLVFSSWRTGSYFLYGKICVYFLVGSPSVFEVTLACRASEVRLHDLLREGLRVVFVLVSQLGHPAHESPFWCCSGPAGA
ncbi:hypothetical protein MTO96_046899 [Rhipicephalus appendiculatus]